MNKYLSIALCGLLLLTGVILFSTKDQQVHLPSEAVSATLSIGGDFSLVDVDGATVDDQIFRGRYMLVFFGFTHCPHICPATLATITQALELLGASADHVAPIFISVDPTEDTPARMKEYLSHFDPRITGLTGSEDAVAQVVSAYKGYHSKQADGSVDHSSFIYLMDTQGQYVTHFASDIRADLLAKELQERMGQ